MLLFHYASMLACLFVEIRQIDDNLMPIGFFFPINDGLFPMRKRQYETTVLLCFVYICVLVRHDYNEGANVMASL